MAKLTAACALLWLANLAYMPVVLGHPHARSDEQSFVARALSKRSQTVYPESVDLASQWDGDVLFSFAAGEAIRGNISGAGQLICTKCYLLGNATATLTINEGQNVTEIFQNVTSNVAGELDNIANTASTDIENAVEASISELENDGFSLAGFSFPPLELNFDLDIPQVPECTFEVQVDAMELYMELEANLSEDASYSVPLYRFGTNISVGDAAESATVAADFFVDLLIEVSGQAEVSGGFHIKLNDGIAVQLPMFERNVSKVDFNGGNIEFLPFTAQNTDLVFTATLQLGVKAGVKARELGITVNDHNFGGSVGIGSEVFVDLAQFKTNLTTNHAEDSECELGVEEVYSLLVGANAGATLAVQNHTWGPAPQTQVPIFYTTLASSCATATSTPEEAVPTITMVERDDVSTMTTTTEILRTATICRSGLNCPASLQATIINTVTQTIMAEVSAGEEATFPATTTAPITPIAFGANAREISTTSDGAPETFTPTSTATSASEEPTETSSESPDFMDEDTGGVSNKTIFGVSLGVGIPVILAILLCSGCMFRYRRSLPFLGRRGGFNKLSGPSGSEPFRDSSRGVSVIGDEPWPKAATAATYELSAPPEGFFDRH